MVNMLTVDPKKLGKTRDDIINVLENENIESRPVGKPMHLQPFYKNYYYSFLDKDISKNLFDTGLCLPSGSSLKEIDQKRIIDIILNEFKSN